MRLELLYIESKAL